MLSQDDRSLGITTALGDGVLFIERITGQESLGNPFEYSVSAVAENDEFSFDDLIGTDATVRLEMRREGAESTRFFNGIVSQVSHLGYDQQGNSRYELTLVPWLWFLTQGADCRIFQQQTVPEILEEVFNIAGVENYDLQLEGQYQPRDYCVQYRETHFNFVQRLMQHEGIYYFWEHKDGEHKMIICDKMSAHNPNPGFEEVKYRSSGASVDEESYISSWKAHQMVTPGVYAHNSFNFEAPKPAPNTKLLGKAEKSHPHSQGEHEVYDNPADFMDLSDGERLAAIRREEIQCDAKTISSVTNVRGLLAGKLFQPLEVPRDDQSGEEFLITACSFQASVGGFGSGTGGGEEGYSASFMAIPSKQCVFRPKRTARIPRMQGPQTAIVTGPSGEEIFVDEFGRVKVQFHWDRNGQYDDGSSCWVRVSQAWAGLGFGSMNVPRIGQEVIVEHIEGNPDLPIITGRVYNGENKPYPSNAGQKSAPPADLSKAGMMMSFKSNSLGGSGGSNEITMNDKGGSETLFFKAQKDEVHVVGNDRTDSVGNDEARDVGNDEKTTIGNDRTEEVGNNETISIGNDRAETVGNDETISIGNDRTESVGNNEEISIGNNEEVSIGNHQDLTVGGNKTTSVTGNTELKIMGNYETAVMGNTEVASTGKIDISSMQSITLSAPMSIKLQVGPSSLELTPAGVTIMTAGIVTVNGTMIKLN